MSELQNVTVAIKGENGKVIIEFSESIRHWVTDPENCLLIAEAMAAAAFECKGGVQPAGPALKASIVDRHHDKMVPRIALMLGSMRGDKKKSDGYIAEQITSTLLAAVF